LACFQSDQVKEVWNLRERIKGIAYIKNILDHMNSDLETARKRHDEATMKFQAHERTLLRDIDTNSHILAQYTHYHKDILARIPPEMIDSIPACKGADEYTQKLTIETIKKKQEQAMYTFPSREASLVTTGVSNMII